MTASVRKFGFELEYASNTNAMVIDLHAQGLMRTAYLHDYHCTCGDCAYLPGTSYGHDDCDDHCSDYGCWGADDHDCGLRSCPRQRRPNGLTITGVEPADLRAQRDSTADGEFITRPLTEWDDLRRIAIALTSAASAAGATAGARCGLHVHVDTSDDVAGCDARGNLLATGRPPDFRTQLRRLVPAAYLAFERYFTEIVAPGASVRKRDMNSTLMEAVRQYVSDNYGNRAPDTWMDLGRGAVDDLLTQVIGRDRHVDLNWSRRHATWEFRCFNSTNAAWRIELACRMAVAFVEATPVLRQQIETTVRGSKFWPDGCDSPWGEILRPAYSVLPTAHPTKRPIVPMGAFIDILCDVDPDLRPLIERQAAFMRTRYAREVECAV